MTQTTPKTVERHNIEEGIGFSHFTPNCEHDFQGWRVIGDGLGGERVCTKCGLGAMAHSMKTGI